MLFCIPRVSVAFKVSYQNDFNAIFLKIQNIKRSVTWWVYNHFLAGSGIVLDSDIFKASSGMKFILVKTRKNRVF